MLLLQEMVAVQFTNLYCLGPATAPEQPFVQPIHITPDVYSPYCAMY